MSTYYTILTQVEAVVTDLLDLAAPSIAVRKRPHHSTPHGDPLPFFCVSPIAERIVNQQFQNGAWVDYPVIVALFQAKGATVQRPSELQYQLATRESIRKALHKPTPLAVSGLFDSDYDPSPAFEIGGMDNMYDVSLQMFTFRVDEARSV